MEVKPGYKQTEVGVIPEEWGIVELDETARVVDSLHQTPSFAEDGYPMVRVTDIKPGNLSFVGTLMVTEAVFAEFTKNYKPKRGDIVLSRVGSYGVSSFVETDEPFCMGQNTVILQPKLPPRFLYYVLNSRSIRQQIEDGSYGSGYKSLSLKNIKELRIPVPPTDDEQRAIAAALSDVDGLLGGLDRLIAKKRDLKQAAMQQLLTGQTRLPGFHGEWEVKRLGTLLRFQVGFPFSSTFFNEKGEGIRLVKNRDLKSDDQVFHYNGKYEEAFVVHDGDVLIGMDGDFLPSQWNKGPALLNQRVGRVVPNSGLNVAFAFYALIEPLKDIEIVTSSTTVKHLSHGDVEGIERPLPELPEQTAIASVLSEMDGELAVLEQRREKTRALKQAMMQELLTGKTRLV